MGKLIYRVPDLVLIEDVGAGKAKMLVAFRDKSGVVAVVSVKGKMRREPVTPEVRALLQERSGA